MRDFDQQPADDGFRTPPEQPERETEDEWTEGDKIAACVIWAVFGGAIGWVLAWGLDLSVGWQVADAAVGAVLVAIIGRLWWASPLGTFRRRSIRQSYRAIRWATEDPEAPENLGEVMHETLLREPAGLSYWAWREAIVFGFFGVVFGLLVGLCWGKLAALLFGLLGLTLGAALGTRLGRGLVVSETVLTIAFVRALGLPLGYACIGVLIGVAFGALLWSEFRHAGWPNAHALAIAVSPPVLFAIIFGILGWQRSKRNKRH